MIIDTEVKKKNKLMHLYPYNYLHKFINYLNF